MEVSSGGWSTHHSLTQTSSCQDQETRLGLDWHLHYRVVVVEWLDKAIQLGSSVQIGGWRNEISDQIRLLYKGFEITLDLSDYIMGFDYRLKE